MTELQQYIQELATRGITVVDHRELSLSMWVTRVPWEMVSISGTSNFGFTVSTIGTNLSPMKANQMATELMYAADVCGRLNELLEAEKLANTTKIQ